MKSLLIILFIITVGTLGWYYYAHYSIIPTYQKKLSTMVHTRFNEINSYLDQQEKYAVQLSQDKAILDALENSPSKRILPILNAYQENMDFKNILLTDKNGKIAFSTTKKDLVETDLKNHTHSSLGKSYQRAMMTLTHDFSQFNFNELLEQPALFITIPLLKEKKYIGTLAYQLDQEKIYRIANQYIGLGKTGEIVLARREGDSLLFVSPTRNDPDIAFKKRPLFTNHPVAIQASVLGQDGSGRSTDYRGKQIVGAWKLIPKIEWGMIVKIDIDEAAESTFIFYTLFLFFLMLFLITLLINLCLFWRQIHHRMIHFHSHLRVPSLIKNPIFILLLIFLGLALKNSFQCKSKKSSTIQKATQQALSNNEKNSENIAKLLEKIAFTGESISKDLHTDYLKKDDIATRIARDLSENNIISEITVIYAPNGYQDKKNIYLKSTTSKEIDREHIFETKWYTQAQEKKVAWIINPIKDAADKPTCTYARALFNNNNEPIGALAITFCLRSIINSIEQSSIGQTGYSFITTDDGTFIFHPISTLVSQEITFLQFAQSQGNAELASIAQQTLNGKPLTKSYKSQTGQEYYRITTQSITPNQWIIGTIFSESEVGLSAQKIRHYYFWILLWFIIALLLCVSLFFTYAFISELAYIGLINLILLLGMMTAWYIITITHSINRESITIITDESSLDKFLNDLNEEAVRKHEPKPIKIPCGLLLYTLNITDSDHIEISGYLWTKYNTTKHKDITRGIDILQSTRMAIGKPLTSITGTIETETWTTQGVLSQEQQNTEYPFDQQKLRIVLEHRDLEKNIILTPDLTGYKTVSPESMAGLDKDFSISGFTVEQTFFEYKQFSPEANFGFKEYGKVTDHFQLVYNVVLSRNLLNPFVLYILPLLVILFSLFCTLLIASRRTDPFSMLGPYTGLFFSMIVLQRSLREQHPSGSTLYMEYAFFYTYITIILLILHTILNHFYKHKITYQNKVFHIMKLLFWPFQLITWLITTLVVFY